MTNSGSRWADTTATTTPSHGQQADLPPGYCVEWSSRTRRRRSLADSRELRSEIVRAGPVAAQVEGGEKLFVIQSLGPHVLETLRGVGGVDAAFLEAHVNRMRYRPSGASGGGVVGPRWWCWEYPQRKMCQDGLGAGWAFLRVSLWASSALTLLLVNRTEPMRSVTKPPRLQHQDAATRKRSSSRRYGTVDSRRSVSSSRPPPPPYVPLTLDADMYELLGSRRPEQQQVEDVIGEAVYERWLDYTDNLTSSKSRTDEATGPQALRLLEKNQDFSRYLEKKKRSMETPNHADWTDLIARVQRRLVSSPSSSRQPGQQNRQENLSQDSKDGDTLNKRALDRISYLGGLLLPINVVSGILAIEGDFGPEGNNFWVFWLTSAVTSAIAIAIIYIDQVRTLQVWIEVAADAMMEASEEEDDDDGEGHNSDDDSKRRQGGKKDPGGVVVQRLADGELVKAWRKKELGWGGAMKKVSGYYRLRGSPGMTFDLPKMDAFTR